MTSPRKKRRSPRKTKSSVWRYVVPAAVAGIGGAALGAYMMGPKLNTVRQQQSINTARTNARTNNLMKEVSNLRTQQNQFKTTQNAQTHKVLGLSRNVQNAKNIPRTSYSVTAGGAAQGLGYLGGVLLMGKAYSDARSVATGAANGVKSMFASTPIAVAGKDAEPEQFPPRRYNWVGPATGLAGLATLGAVGGAMYYGSRPPSR